MVAGPVPGSWVGQWPVCPRVEAGRVWPSHRSLMELSLDPMGAEERLRIYSFSPDRAGHSHRHCALAGSSRFWQPSSRVGTAANMKHLQRPFATICAGNREAGSTATAFQPRTARPMTEDAVSHWTFRAPPGPGFETQVQLGTRTRVPTDILYRQLRCGGRGRGSYCIQTVLLPAV